MVETLIFRPNRDSYPADVRKSSVLGCETCSDVGMGVGGRSTTDCGSRLRTDAAGCMNRYTYYILHNDLREDINTT